VSEPRGVHSCPADVWSIWNGPRYGGGFLNPVVFKVPRRPAGGSVWGIPLRAGAHAYRFSLAMVAKEGPRPGRTLVCAAVYDELQSEPAVDQEEGSARFWITAVATRIGVPRHRRRGRSLPASRRVVSPAHRRRRLATGDLGPGPRGSQGRYQGVTLMPSTAVRLSIRCTVTRGGFAAHVARPNSTATFATPTRSEP
ncbi:MAG: hypothetical protein ACRDNS_07060, partial [Trebonia sp.]